MADELRVLRAADYPETPWKNGGGVTREVLRMPDTPRFDWRVSVARIDRPGPFSDFAGYRRHMALLAGSGVRLRFAHSQRELRVPGDLVEFDGAERVDCELLAGTCTDLNLMVASALPARVRVLSVAGPVMLEAAPDESALLFAMTAPLAVSHGGRRVQLGIWDALQWHGGGAAALATGLAGADAPNLVFFATIGHGRQPPTAPVRR